MHWLTYLITPVMGAVIGYFTNWLAIKMLFRPHREVRIAGFKLPFTPGLIPKERERLTLKISETVSKHVLTKEVLAKELASAGIWRDLQESTINGLLAKLGVDDPAARIEKVVTDVFSDPRFKQTLAETAAKGMRALTDGPLTETFKTTAVELLPKAVDYIKQWPESYPWLDEKLSAVVRKIIDDNFGRLIGLFIDHNKIYASIKDGLFNYLSDTENQRFMSEQLIEGAARALPGLEDKLTAAIIGSSDISETGLPQPIKTAIASACAHFGGMTIGELLQYKDSSRIESNLPSGETAALTDGLSSGEESTPSTDDQKNASAPQDQNPLGLGRVLEQIAEYIASQMRIREMIEDKINAFTVEEAESLILSVVNHELQAITVLGGVLGFLIGLLSMIPQLL